MVSRAAEIGEIAAADWESHYDSGDGFEGGGGDCIGSLEEALDPFADFLVSCSGEGGEGV